MPVEMLLLGGGILQRRPDGQFVTKSAVAAYVNELATYFSPMTWATSVDCGSLILNTPLDESCVSLCPVGGTARTLMADFRRLRRRNSLDTVILLYMPSPWLALSALALSRRCRGLFVYLANDFIGHSQEARTSRGWLYSLLYRKLHELVIYCAKGVIARGARLKSIACGLNPNVIETVPIALRPEIYQTPHSATERQRNSCCMLYVGKLKPEKGVDVLINSIAILRDHFHKRNLKVCIVGSGSARSMLERQVVSLGLGDTVRFLGYIDNPKRLAELYMESDVVVVPSVYPEGAPRVIDEALNCGVPVVASAIGGIPAEYANRVLLVPPGDVDALAQGIVQILEDEKLRDQMRSANYGKVSTSQISPARQHAEFIRKTLEREAIGNVFSQGPRRGVL